MKRYATQLKAKHFLRGSFLVVGLLLVISVLPPIFGGAGRRKKSARQITSFHAFKPLDSEGFRGFDWQEQKVTANDGVAFDDFAWSVALSGDTAFICTPYTLNSKGASYVFGRTGSTWSQLQKLSASDGADGDSFGWSVALDDDTAVVGAPNATV